MADQKADTAASRCEADGFTRETILDVLSNRRRRFALHVLKRRPGDTVDRRTLAERVACWEHDVSVDELSYKQRKCVGNALHQYHLPKLDEYGVVDYDEDAGEVTLTDRGRNCDFYLDVLPAGGHRWDALYLGLSALGVLSVVGIQLGLFPFVLLSALQWGGVFVVVLATVSIWHYYDRSRTGFAARDRPVEVGNT